MSGIEIVLILVGIVFMIGSFLVTEKLSVGELNKIAELSQSEISRIAEKELKKAAGRIDEQIEEAIEDSISKVERSLDKETNEKIMAIGEYSDTVVETMNKTHNEIMFLYSMLNDKHTELTELAGEISRVSVKLETQIEKISPSKKAEVIVEQPKAAEQAAATEQTELEDIGNNNDKILALYESGKTYIEIAKELGLGLGEVRLVIELFKGEN